MASGETTSAVAAKKLTDLLPHDLKAIESVCQYANQQELVLKKLTKDVDGLGLLGKIWDSKVPELNKKFYYFFTLKRSDPKKIKEAINEYLEFYKLLTETVQKLKSDNEKAKDNKESENETFVYALILDLYEKLLKLAKEAETGKGTTGSTTVYKLHTDFIQKQEKLENMIRRVECVSLKQSWNKAMQAVQESKESIKNLQVDLRNANTNYENLSKNFNTLIEENRKLAENQNTLMRENSKIMEENSKIMDQQNMLSEQNKTMGKQIDLLIKIISIKSKEKKDDNNGE